MLGDERQRPTGGGIPTRRMPAPTASGNPNEHFERYRP
jgi:hypothetical protein